MPINITSQYWAVNEVAFKGFMSGIPLTMQTFNPDVMSIDDSRRSGLPVVRDGRTAIVSVSGPIMKSNSFLSRFLGFSSSASIAAAVTAAADDPEIETIILMCDSPGGTVAGTQYLADTVAAAATKKPVIAQVDGMCASACYWVASQATRIIASGDSEIGSIGVRMAIYDFSEAFRTEGIKPIPIDTGEFKSMGLQGTEVTEAQVAHLQGIVDGIFEDFKSTILSGRSMSAEGLNNIADGRMFRAEDALANGLIDGIAHHTETLQEIRSKQAPKTARRTRALKAHVALNARHL
ncbi:S49 family peptidase [Kiloniella antarctica]|uniref:S49 family peptidase n=1 Tax=Kiloniella antarctica TaxID=1550907 RepID=A0ABW5BPE9_9PROT